MYYNDLDMFERDDYISATTINLLRLAQFDCLEFNNVAALRNQGLIEIDVACFSFDSSRYKYMTGELGRISLETIEFSEIGKKNLARIMTEVKFAAAAQYKSPFQNKSLERIMFTEGGVMEMIQLGHREELLNLYHGASIVPEKVRIVPLSPTAHGGHAEPLLFNGFFGYEEEIGPDEFKRLD